MEKTLARRAPLCARRRATLPIPEQKRTKTNGIGTKTNKCERNWNETGTKLEQNRTAPRLPQPGLYLLVSLKSKKNFVQVHHDSTIILQDN
jgi:hypothetical protein